jgi:hypothetical protein
MYCDLLSLRERNHTPYIVMPVSMWRQSLKFDETTAAILLVINAEPFRMRFNVPLTAVGFAA